ncbi:MAG: hypothetical protein KDC44_15675, partial [Phaeodactylibacter sp.]|nr:hypothetical protein [Phaeodactylibacter sp.]
IISWVLKNNGSIEAAKDLFQEGLVKVFLMAGNPEFQLRCSFGYFFSVICHRQWIDQLRKNKKQQAVRLSELLRITNEEAIHPQEIDILEEALQKEELLDKTFLMLSELCQQLLLLVRKGLPVKEMVQTLQMNAANTFYQRKRACTHRWAQLFKTELESRS